MNQFNYKLVGVLFLSTTLILSFQNCSKIQVSSLDSSEQGSLSSPADSNDHVSGGSNTPPGDSIHDPSDLGLQGGHFDLDTSSKVYEFNKGSTDHHEHEYDDKNDVKVVDFFKLIQKDFTTIPSRVQATQEFIIIVVNAKLSPGALLEINGETISAVDYQKQVDLYIEGDKTALRSFTLANLNDFKLKFASENLQNNVLVATATGCVRANKPSVRGEYRNGALTIQLLDKNTAIISPAYRAAGSSGGLLWEATIFWHKNSTCQ